MTSNLEKYQENLDHLISTGCNLLNAMRYEYYPKEFTKDVKKKFKEKYEKFLKELPSFREEYQLWYSESLVVIKLLLPDRVDNFVNLYEKPEARKEITHESYVVADYLYGLGFIDQLGHKILKPESAILKFQQQLSILRSAERRFENSLFDIQQVMQADLFDSELDAAKELNKKGFIHGAGAIAGVVLEKHLSQICKNRNIKIKKRNPTINDYNELLKKYEIIEVKDWRLIQRLADLRNSCTHNKKMEPTKDDVSDLISGVDKISKTIY